MLFATVALASAFMAPLAHPSRIAVSMGGKGFGGGEATRDPAPTAYDPNDPKGKQQAIHKAESFSEYLAKRGAGGDAAPAGDETLDSAPPAAAPAPAGGVSVGGAGDIVTGWQPAMMQKVVDTLSLTANTHPQDVGFDSFTIAGSAGQIVSYEGPGAPNIAWCSGLTMNGAEVARGSITAFCGPLTDVPHLIATCGVSNGGIDLYIDWRPRAESGYDPDIATLADYPDPTTREAFSEGGNRKDFAAAFYTDEVAAWRDSLMALGVMSAYGRTHGPGHHEALCGVARARRGTARSCPPRRTARSRPRLPSRVLAVDLFAAHVGSVADAQPAAH
jgi:hypothetical protein